MLRSTIQCMANLGSALAQGRTKLSTSCGVLFLNTRQLSLSVPRCGDQKKQRPRKDKGSYAAKDTTDTLASPEIKKAAVQAAKSMPGDWTKTAEELLARLQSKSVKTESQHDRKESVSSGTRSLLSTMKVGRSFEKSRNLNKRRGERDTLRRQNEESVFPQSIVEKVTGDKQTSRDRRRTPVFQDLYGVPRLNIFKAKESSEVTHNEKSPQQSDDLWAKVEKEHVRKLQGGLPRNAFEEMIRLTEQGKVWTFPIDNEADLHEERKYKFHDHVFLERHLTAFPSNGPIRKFMELVTLGLSQNPWLTVPEKLEHITWFAQYFREKQDLLKSTLGEQGEMKESIKEVES